MRAARLNTFAGIPLPFADTVRPPLMERIETWLTEHSDRFVDELTDFLRIASVSADSRHLTDMSRAAEFVRQQLNGAGVEARIVETDGHAIVFGQRTEQADAPTALIYGHYDVQPPDPLDEWHTPPFDPDVREGCVYARGATDDKGQLFTHIKSVEAWVKATGSLPVNVKFVIEGEEELGSDNLDRFLADNRDLMSCDVAVISDPSQYGPDMPAITHGLRGLLACQVELTGPNQDLHSGVFGGSVVNPANALARLVGTLHDADGRVRIPGFYDDVLELSDAQRGSLAALPFDEAAYMAAIGITATGGEHGYTTLERRWARPTCDVNGLISGYTGEGPKTIVPARSMAKISCRLVPDQDSAELLGSLESWLRANCPAGLELKFTPFHGCPAVVFDTDSVWMRAARGAIETAFGVAPVLIREGGSIPVVTTFRDVLGVDTLLLGWGQNTDNLHSPNEHFSLRDFQRGIRASAHLWQQLANTRDQAGV